MYYRYKPWIDDKERCVYLGSDINPNTGMKYDFWCIKTGSHAEKEHNYSYTCRHGMRPEDYGSGPITCGWYDRTHFGTDLRKDFIWGLDRAIMFTLYYLATGRKPLLDKEI